MLLTAKYVVPVTSGYIEDGAVLVRDDKIAAVGTLAELKEAYPGEEVKDLGLAALAPGFVDLHTHLRYTAMRGMFEDMGYADWRIALYKTQPYFLPEDWDSSARLGALEAIASGITTVADITGRDSSVRAIADSGLRAVVYREIRTPYASEVDSSLAEALDDIAEWEGIVDPERVQFGLAAGYAYATHPKVYKAIAEHVGSSDMHVAMHLAATQEECDFLRYGSSPFSVHANQQVESVLNVVRPVWLPAGVSPVRYVYNWDILELPNVLIVHGVHVSDDDIDILARNNVALAFCPRINAKLGMGIAPINKYLEAGITVGMGTDSPAAVDTIDMIDEMRAGLLLTRASVPSSTELITSEKMLRMATIDAAKALRMDDKVGSLEVGKQADIIAIDLHNSHQNPTTNPPSAIIYTANQDNVKMTMVGGKILFDEFVHVSGLARDQIVERSASIRERIRENMNDEEIRRQVNERLKAFVETRVKR